MELSFAEAFERIKGLTGCRTQMELAELFEIRQSSISDASRRNAIPDGWLVKLVQLYGVNPDWVRYGTEPKYVGGGLTPPAQTPASELPEEEIIRAAIPFIDKFPLDALMSALRGHCKELNVVF